MCVNEMCHPYYLKNFGEFLKPKAQLASHSNPLINLQMKTAALHCPFLSSDAVSWAAVC